MSTFASLPDGLPIPQDDGACAHLQGTAFPPSLALPVSTDPSAPPASLSSLSQDGLVILFCYPRSGAPDEVVPEEWDAIPGARGCTPQNCSYRDAYPELLQQGVKHVFGCSTQASEVHQELHERLHLPYHLLSDEQLDLVNTLKLPTFTWQGKSLVKRLTLAIENGKIVQVWYPVFPTNKNVDAVLQWLKTR